MKTVIRLFPDPILRQLSTPHRGSYEQLVRDLLDTMDGIGYGLSGPQIGVSTRVAVVQTKQNAPPIVLVNPELISSGEYRIAEEGCLSLPGLRAIVERHERVRVTSEAWEGMRVFNGLTARAIQHECDHLDGILICDAEDVHERVNSVYSRLIGQ